jgi:hypothetical protein
VEIGFARQNSVRKIVLGRKKRGLRAIPDDQWSPIVDIRVYEYMGWVSWPFGGLQGREIESPYWFEGFEVRKIQILGLGPGFLSQDFGVPIFFFFVSCQRSTFKY